MNKDQCLVVVEKDRNSTRRYPTLRFENGWWEGSCKITHQKCKHNLLGPDGKTHNIREV